MQIQIATILYLTCFQGYQHYNGLSGISKKSGCGFYIKEGINYIDRTDLDIYDSNENHESTDILVKMIQIFLNTLAKHLTN